MDRLTAADSGTQRNGGTCRCAPWSYGGDIMATVATRQPAAIRPAEPREQALARVHWYPTLTHVWMMLAVVAAALSSALRPIESIDYWWSVRIGDVIRATGLISADDPLIYTPIRGPIIDGQWLAKVVLSWTHDVGGVELSLALRSALTIVAALLLLRACRVEGAGPRASALAAGLAVILFAPGLAVRPQLLAVIPFLVVWQAALHPPRSVLAALGVGALTAFWANVHGSVILIVPLVGAGLVEALLAWWHQRDRTRLRRWFVLAVICTLAPLCNPYGLGLARYVLDTVLVNGGGTSIGVLGVEWMPPVLQSTYGGAYFASVFVVIGLLACGRRPRAGEAVLMVSFGLLALSSLRHILWWSLVATPFIARASADVVDGMLVRLRRHPGPLAAGSPRLNVVCMVALGTFVVLALPWWRTQLPLPRKQTALIDPSTPVAVADYLATHPLPGRLFNDTDWSAYLAWRLGDEGAMFIDNRFELHPIEIWKEYTIISRGHVSWERRLDSYGVTRLALEPESQVGLVEAVRDSPNWRLVYQDEQALVFDRVTEVGTASTSDAPAEP